MVLVRACYKRHIRKHPSVSGAVTVRFIIDPEGQVKTAAISESSIGVHAIHECVLDAVKRQSFPKPPGGGIVVVNSPFILRTHPPWALCL